VSSGEFSGEAPFVQRSHGSHSVDSVTHWVGLREPGIHKSSALWTHKRTSDSVQGLDDKLIIPSGVCQLEGRQNAHVGI
jgi:hypothetical protein